MVDFNILRETMVDCQVQTFTVTDRRILNAMHKTPREIFVPENAQVLAYSDQEIPFEINNQPRAMMTPMALARLMQLAQLEPDHQVLDIGCLFGYSTALIAQLVESVVGLEQGEEQAQKCQENLAKLSINNAPIVSGSLVDGLASQGPFDVIFIQGAVDKVPQKILKQLKDGGRLVTVQKGEVVGLACWYSARSGLYQFHPGFELDVPVLPMFDNAQAFVF